MNKTKNEVARRGLKLFVSMALICILAIFILVLLFKSSVACGCYNPIYDLTATAFAAKP